MRGGSIPEMTVVPVLPDPRFRKWCDAKNWVERLPLLPRFEVHRSQPVTWLDRACALLLLQLVRCHVCLRRTIVLFSSAHPNSSLDPRRNPLWPLPTTKSRSARRRSGKGHANSETAQFASSSPERSPCKSETDSRITENRAVGVASAPATPISKLRPKWMEFLLTTSSQRHLNDLISFFEFHPCQQLVNGSATNAEDLGSAGFAAADCLQDAQDVTPLQLFEGHERFICGCIITEGCTEAFGQIIDVD